MRWQALQTNTKQTCSRNNNAPAQWPSGPLVLSSAQSSGLSVVASSSNTCPGAGSSGSWLFSVAPLAFSSYLLAARPTLLERKAEKLRKETGNLELRSVLTKQIPPREVFTRAIARPMKMLFLSPIVGLMSLYVAVNYGILYLFFTTITFVFEGTYGFSSGAVGLSYIGVGVGSKWTLSVHPTLPY
jgi:hypothetical protein